MDEIEFRRLLNLFPIVRSRNYRADSESTSQSLSLSAQNNSVEEWDDASDEGNEKELEINGMDEHDAFWEKLKFAAQKKMGAAEAKKFCRAFHRAHLKLVYQELTPDAAWSLIKSSKGPGE